MVAAVVLAGAASVTTAAAGPTTERVSVGALGLQRTVPSLEASMSGDGRRVAFATFAFGEDPGARYPRFDVYVRDRQTGRTSVVSAGPHGEPGDGSSYQPSMSADGRYVAFDSDSDNLGPDAGGQRAGAFYVRDLAAGKTTAVVVRPRSADEWVLAGEPSISGDGRYVAYVVGRSRGNGGYRYDVAVRDRYTGTDRLVSVARRGGAANGDSFTPAISPNGRFVVFASLASDLVAGDANRRRDVFVRDLRTGTTSRVSVSSRGVAGNQSSGTGSVSANGRFVAFSSSASNLVRGDTNRTVDVFVRDLANRKTRRVSVDSAGRQADDESELPSISADGRYVGFLSVAKDLVKGDTNGVPDVFVHDLKTGATRRVSVGADGQQANDASYLYNGYNTAPSISSDGGYVAFQSFASNLVPNDTNGQMDVFVRGPLVP